VIGVGWRAPLHELGARRLVRSNEWQNVPWLASPLVDAAGVDVFPNASYLQAIFIFSSGADAGWDVLALVSGVATPGSWCLHSGG